MDPSIPGWLRAALPATARLTEARGEAARFREWFESAMVMVDSVPIGVIWSDPKRDFLVTYVNGFGRAMLAPQLPPGAFDDTQLPRLFPDLAAHRAALAAAAEPVRLQFEVGSLRIEMQVLAIRNAAGEHIGSMAAWTDVTLRARLAEAFQANVAQAVGQVDRMVAELGATASRMCGNSGRANTGLDADADTVQRSAAALSGEGARLGREVASFFDTMQSGLSRLHAGATQAAAG